MEPPSTDVIQGTLDLLILRTLSLAPMHGYRHHTADRACLARCLQGEPGLAADRACGAWSARAGSTPEWRDTENARRAKFHSLTLAGRKAAFGPDARGAAVGRSP